MIQRTAALEEIRRNMGSFPVTALFGPRQCGKTTLARLVTGVGEEGYFDLEDPVSQRRLAEPMTALRPLRGLVVIDEVQRQPDLFPVLRVLADRRPLPARFLVLGSASPELLQQGSETLAGRIGLIEMSGFSLAEVGSKRLRKLWWRGGFPRPFLARTEAESRAWQENFIRTFLERDIRQFGVEVPPTVLRRIWMMLAHYHGQIWNASEISRSLGEAHTTVKRHLDLLTGACVVRQLQPWFNNAGKRLIKSPKIFLRDSGLLHTLLGLSSFRMLEGNAKIGASWEGFVIEEAIRIVGDRNAYFWATQSGAEMDLFVQRNGKKYGIEVKYKDAPGITKSMRIAQRDLELDKVIIVYPGEQSYVLDKDIVVVPVDRLSAELGVIS